MKLTRSKFTLLCLAASRQDGTIHVFLDMRKDVDALEREGLFFGNGKMICRETTITESGRRALAEQEGK